MERESRESLTIRTRKISPASSSTSCKALSPHVPLPSLFPKLHWISTWSIPVELILIRLYKVLDKYIYIQRYIWTCYRIRWSASTKTRASLSSPIVLQFQKKTWNLSSTCAYTLRHSSSHSSDTIHISGFLMQAKICMYMLR